VCVCPCVRLRTYKALFLKTDLIRIMPTTNVLKMRGINQTIPFPILFCQNLLRIGHLKSVLRRLSRRSLNSNLRQMTMEWKGAKDGDRKYARRIHTKPNTFQTDEL